MTETSNRCSVVFTGINPVTGEDFELLLLREGKFGFIGSHLDIKGGEQLFESIIRKVEQELADHDGKPVITALDPEKLVLAAEAELQAGASWKGYTYRLSKEQVKQLWMHIWRFHNDASYRMLVVQASDGKMEDVIMEPMSVLWGTQLATLARYFADSLEEELVLKVTDAIQA